MLIFGWLQWWYGRGWLTAAERLKQKINRTLLAFSVPVLLRTLFKPWRQILSGPNPNAQIGQKFRAAIDNLISRFIGFWVRLLTVLTAGLVVILLCVIGLILLIVWPVVPLAILTLALRGVGLL